MQHPYGHRARRALLSAVTSGNLVSRRWLGTDPDDVSFNVYQPTNAKENSRSGYTGNTVVDGVTLDGTRLWRIDLGRNIRSGAHCTQFQVHDHDGDGKAETAMKTADGGEAADRRTRAAASPDGQRRPPSRPPSSPVTAPRRPLSGLSEEDVSSEDGVRHAS